MLDVSKVIKVAENEIGYLEKRSDKDLDSKTANAGSGNWTKFGRDLVKWIGSPFANGVAWCQEWCQWIFIEAYGLDTAKKMLGGWTAYCPTAKTYYVNMGRWSTKPQKGDQIFFKNGSGTICHTGIVYKVDGSFVYTIEGNTSGANGVIANGGGVCRKKYVKTFPRIAGYGRPDYSIAEVKPAPKPKPQEDTKPKAKGYTGTYPKVNPLLKKGSKGTQVKNLQKYLNWFGAYGLEVDGDFGSKTQKAVKDFQKRTGLAVDGIFGKNSLAMAKEMKK